MGTSIPGFRHILLHLPGNIYYMLCSWLGTRAREISSPGNTPTLASTRPKKGNGEEEGTAGKGETKEKAEPSRTSKMRARRDTAPHCLGRS